MSKERDTFEALVKSLRERLQTVETARDDDLAAAKQKTTELDGTVAELQKSLTQAKERTRPCIPLPGVARDYRAGFSDGCLSAARVPRRVRRRFGAAKAGCRCQFA